MCGGHWFDGKPKWLGLALQSRALAAGQQSPGKVYQGDAMWWAQRDGSLHLLLPAGMPFHHQFGHYNIDSPPIHSKQGCEPTSLPGGTLTPSLSAPALCGVPTSPVGRTRLLPALPWPFPIRWQGWDRTPPAPVLPPPAELGCPGLKTAHFSPPLKCQCFETAFWKYPI